MSPTQLAAFCTLMPVWLNAQTAQDSTVLWTDRTPVAVNVETVRQLIQIPREPLSDGQTQSADFGVFIDPNGRYIRHIPLYTPTTLLSQYIEPHLHQLVFTPAIDSGRAVPASFTFRFSAHYPQCTPAQDTICFSIQYVWDQSNDIEVFVGDGHPEPLNLAEIKQRIQFPNCPDAKIVGTVIYRLWVDEAGRVLCYHLLRTPHPCLITTIEPHLLDIRFRPTGQRVWVSVPFRMGIQQR